MLVSKIQQIVLVWAACLSLSYSVYAQDNLTWKSPVDAAVAQDGPGTWNTTDPFWVNSGGGSSNFSTGDNVTFGANFSIFASPYDVSVTPVGVTVGTMSLNTTVTGAFYRFGGSSITGTSLTLNNVNGVQFNNSVTFSGGTTISSGTMTVGDGSTSGALSSNVTVTSPGTLRFDRSGSVAFSNSITGNGGLTVTGGSGAGTGTVTLTNNNAAYTGIATVQNSGTLQLGNGGGSGGIGSGSVNLSTSGSSLVLNRDSSSTLTVLGSVSGNGQVRKLGSGTAVLAGAANNYSGGTTIDGGTLQVSSSVGAGAISINNGSVFQFTGGGLLSVGTINLNNGSITGGALTSSASYNVQAGSISSTLGGSAGLTKTSGGTLTLSGGNFYSGTTTVSAGTLLLNGTSSSSNLVVNGGTLGGTGSATGNLTVNSGGRLSPGTSIGTMNLTGNLTLNSGSFFDYEYNRLNSTADLFNVSGALSLGGATLNLSELANGLASKFTLFSYGGPWDGSTFAGLANNAEFAFGSSLWTIRYDDTSAGVNGGSFSNFVSITAVPEPSSLLLLGLSAVGLAFRRKR